MQRRLSSALTFFVKVMHPFISISILILFNFAIYLAPNKGGTLQVLKLILPIILILGAIHLYRTCIRLKQISMNEEALYISNYLKKIRILLRDVESVREKHRINIRHVEIEFRHDTDFGKQVVFMPKLRWFNSRGPHPVVAELQAAVRSAK